jgi:hypothetical protein
MNRVIDFALSLIILPVALFLSTLTLAFVVLTFAQNPLFLLLAMLAGGISILLWSVFGGTVKSMIQG